MARGGSSGPSGEGIEGLDRLIHKAMDEWKVPGLGIAVVRGTGTVLAAGYGLRDVHAERPVTARTLFAIASVSKAFTATCLGILVDEGKLDWDTPVRDYLPGFRLHDPVAADRVTARDLLCHRTGLPRHDCLWYGTDAERWDLLDRLRYLEPSRDLRVKWQYQNLMYMTAGLLIEQITGMNWECFVRERILGPLGMARTTVDVRTSQDDDDYALPYRLHRNRAVLAGFYTQGAIAPAGGLNSCADEMAQWLKLNLRSGRIGRRRIVSAETLRTIHSPHAVVSGDAPWPEFHHPTYALGWEVQCYRGRRVLRHGGNIRGFSSHAWIMPKEGIGLAVLTNMTAQPVPALVACYAADRLLGVRPAPWFARFKKARDKQKRDKAAERRRAARKRARGTRPSHPASDYAGEYKHPAYGTVAVQLKAGKLHALHYGVRKALRHYHHDVFDCDGLFLEEKRRLSFLSNAEGVIDRLTVPLEPEVEPIVFVRRPSLESG